MGEDLRHLRIKYAILRKLHRKAMWGGNYRPLETAISGVPSHEKGLARKVAAELVKTGWLLEHKGGHTISLNVDMKREIDEFIKKHATEELD
ncbi:MAG TPA: hypothetical protein VJA40_04690 [archaeon]|nr:hypothetical protein [archaeon]